MLQELCKLGNRDIWVPFYLCIIIVLWAGDVSIDIASCSVYGANVLGFKSKFAKVIDVEGRRLGHGGFDSCRHIRGRERDRLEALAWLRWGFS
jgi:hypothetical protein